MKSALWHGICWYDPYCPTSIVEADVRKYQNVSMEYNDFSQQSTHTVGGRVDMNISTRLMEHAIRGIDVWDTSECHGRGDMLCVVVDNAGPVGGIGIR